MLGWRGFDRRPAQQSKGHFVAQMRQRMRDNDIDRQEYGKGTRTWPRIVLMAEY